MIINRISKISCGVGYPPYENKHKRKEQGHEEEFKKVLTKVIKDDKITIVEDIFVHFNKRI